MIYYYGIGQQEHIPLTPQFLISYYAMKSVRTPWNTLSKPWMLDSGGFTIGMREGTKNYPHNKIVEYPWSKDAYITFVNKWKPQVAWTMDYAVKVANTPDILKTKQMRTIENTAYLKDKIQAPTVLGAVLQGWENPDYLTHLDMYKEAGIMQPWFAIGFSLQRLSLPTTMDTIIDIKRSLPAWVKFHGFSVKLATLNKYPRIAKYLYSADSAAWIANGAFHIPGTIQAGALNNFVERMENKLQQLLTVIDEEYFVQSTPTVTTPTLQPTPITQQVKPVSTPNKKPALSDWIQEK